MRCVALKSAAIARSTDRAHLVQADVRYTTLGGGEFFRSMAFWVPDWACAVVDGEVRVDATILERKESVDIPRDLKREGVLGVRRVEVLTR